jgi:hypothetical protein
MAMTPVQMAVLVLSFAALIAMAVFYLRDATYERFRIPISPSFTQELYIMGGVVTVLGAVGIYALIHSSWGNATWVFYTIVNLLIAGYIYNYQLKYKYQLTVSALIMIVITVECYFLAHSVTLANPHLQALISLIGVVEGWSSIWSMYVMSQAMVHDCGVNKKTQTVLFFVKALVIIGLEVLGKRYSTGPNWLNFIGFLVAAIGLTVLMFLRQDKHTSIL